MVMTTDMEKAFFAYAREREAIRLRRAKGTRPLTQDPILAQYRFCNVEREHDTVTRWLAEYVRGGIGPTGEYAGPPPHVQLDDLLLAVVLFRWFNRVTVGEAIWLQRDLDGSRAWTRFVKSRDVNQLRRSIVAYIGKDGPFVTGSYIIQGWTGMPKLDGVLKCVEHFTATAYSGGDYEEGPLTWEEMTERLLRHQGLYTLQQVHGWLRQFPYLGDFMAYEIVTDLSHTPLLNKAPDIMSWAMPGPGAMRGLNRIYGRDLHSRAGKPAMLAEMQQLLKRSLAGGNWPRRYQPWNMRTVEHTLCEFDKYQRALLGEGRPRQIFKGG